MQLTHGFLIDIERCHRGALERLGEVENDRADVADRILKVRFKVAPAYDSFFGFHINEDEWPLRNGVGPLGQTVGPARIDHRAGLSKDGSPWPSTARTASNSSAKSLRNSWSARPCMGSPSATTSVEI